MKNQNLNKLSLSDLRALVEILKEKEKLFEFGGNTDKATSINFQIQDIEDYIDSRLLDLGIKL